MKRVCVLGHFAFGKTALNGQTVKTKILCDALRAHLGEDEVLAIDTAGGAKALLRAPFQVLAALKKSKNVLMLPAHNGLRVFGRLLPFFRPLFRRRRLYYVVIGGWLPQFLEGRPGLSRALRRFDGIYVETNTMKRALEEEGFDNILVLPNCKDLRILREDELVFATGEPYRLCTFSRVNEKKGIGDAVAAVRTINETYGRTVYSLDIYGAIDAGEEAWFAALQKEFPDYVRYGGAVPYDQSVETLKDYFALLFPTKYDTEGIPGTILDAYAAGVPVISARWESFSDVVDEGETGLGYAFGDAAALTATLAEVAEAPEHLSALKPACLAKSGMYTPEATIGKLTEKLI